MPCHARVDRTCLLGGSGEGGGEGLGWRGEEGFLHGRCKASGLVSGFDIPKESRKHKHSTDQAYINKEIKELVFLNDVIRIAKGKSTFPHLCILEKLAICLGEQFFTVMQKKSCYPISCSLQENILC